MTYPNAAMSTKALKEWAESSAAVSSTMLADSWRILEQATKSWGRRR